MKLLEYLTLCNIDFLLQFGEVFIGPRAISEHFMLLFEVSKSSVYEVVQKLIQYAHIYVITLML